MGGCGTAEEKGQKAVSGFGSLLTPRFGRGRILLAAVATLLFVSGCKHSVSDIPLGPTVEIHPPLGLPDVPIPADNSPTADAIALGRMLFYDKRLSRDDSIACSSCHKPELDFTDHTSVALGVAGKVGVRNAPTLENSAYLPLQFWDGRASSLELQAAGPIANPGLSSIQAALAPADSEFLYFVARADGSGGHTFSESLMKHEAAVAQYQRATHH